MTTRRIYRESPSSEYLIRDGTVVLYTAAYTLLGTGAAVAPVLRRMEGYVAPGWIVLFVGCCIGVAGLTWLIRVQNKLRLTVYEETTEDTPEEGVIGEVWNQTRDGQLRRANPRLHRDVLARLGVVVHGNIRAGKRNARQISRDDMDTAMTLANKSWSHDEWRGLRQEFERVGWVDKYGKVTAAFWSAVGLASPATTEQDNEVTQ